MIFGVVVFVFPLIIIGISVNELRETLFMVFYLIGPFGALVGTIPGITQLRVHLKRINALEKELGESPADMETEPHMVKALPPDSVLRLQDVVYTYREEDGAGKPLRLSWGRLMPKSARGNHLYHRRKWKREIHLGQGPNRHVYTGIR